MKTLVIVVMSLLAIVTVFRDAPPPAHAETRSAKAELILLP